MKGKARDNSPNDLPADADRLERLKKFEERISALAGEFERLEKEGGEIRRELLNLIDKAKIAKVKNYIDKQK